MRWTKKGLIFAPDHNFSWMVSHASLPTPDRISDEILRIYFGTRDEKGRSHIGYVDLAADNPQNIVAISEAPILQLGKRGTFDDNGTTPSSILNQGGRKFLYYIGWNPQVTVSYRLAIGLAISEEDDTHFQKYSEGPICDRSIEEPFFAASPCVLLDHGVWRMWYISCTGWEIIGDWPEPHYHVKYAESSDGIRWRTTGLVCIDYDEFTGAIARPWVFSEQGIYKMFYSYRGVKNYRIDPSQSYRLGYAESQDGVTWTRKDDQVGIAQSENGWDSEMLEYGSVYQHSGRTYMFYNGNGFGKSGFGYATLED